MKLHSTVVEYEISVACRPWHCHESSLNTEKAISRIFREIDGVKKFREIVEVKYSNSNVK